MRIIRCLALFCSLFALPAFSQPITEIAEVLNWYRLEGFSGHVVVVKGSNRVLDEKVGFASHALSEKFADEPQFCIASVSKQITAAAILRLQDLGFLQVTDRIAKHLGDIPFGDQITIHQLLNHTSGLKNYTDLPGFFSDENLKKHYLPNDLIELIRKEPLGFIPGSQWSYSNTGYVVLGMLIEKISQKSYDQFLQEDFFTKHSMNKTGYAPDQPFQAAKGHSWDSDYLPTQTEPNNFSWAYAAGGIYSTANDMLKWTASLHQNGLLSKKSYEAMITPELNNYGYGLLISTISGKKSISHTGGLTGFASQVISVPEENIHVVVLSNLSDLLGLTYRLGNALATVAIGEAITLPEHLPDLSLAASQKIEYTGNFLVDLRQGNNLKTSIFLKEEKLYLHAENQSALRLLCQEPDHFAARVSDIRLKFRRAQSGDIEGFTLLQNSQEFTATKQVD